MKSTLLLFAAFMFAVLAWFVAQARAEYRWAHQKIPMKHLFTGTIDRAGSIWRD